jgi:ABC-type antimicrobial peptide transport system permease subunit
MIIKNLLRRKIRTLLTVIAISIGVAAIVALGAMADGLRAGYGSMLSGSKADLVMSQPDAYDISFSVVDEKIADELAGMPEVAEVSGMLQGWSQTEVNHFSSYLVIQMTALYWSVFKPSMVWDWTRVKLDSCVENH